MLNALCGRFRGQSEGSVAIWFALTLLPLAGAVGAAVDYSRANAIKSGLQATLDAAVLAGAKDATSNWDQVALNFFNGNLAAKGSTIATPTFTFSNGSYSGSVTAAVPTSFLGVFKISSLNVSVRTASSKGSDPDTSCILTLDHGKPTSDVSMTFNGNPNVNLSGCSIQSNTSLDCNGHSGGATSSIASGTSSGCSNPKSNAPPLPDIYAPLASNITKKCGGVTTGATWVPGSPPSAPNMLTVNQNGYTEYHVCGDLTLSGTGYLTGTAPTSDSVIIIENGGLNIANNASVSTLRVAIVLTGTSSTASQITFPNGNGHSATLSLSPVTGTGNPWRGVSLYQDPNQTTAVNNSWGPGATLNLDGIAYLPYANLTTKGNSASSNSQCSKIVLNTLTTNGSINLSFAHTSAGCATLGVKQYAGTGVRLTQ